MSLNILLEAADFIDRGDGSTSAGMSGDEPSPPAQNRPKPMYRTIWSRSDDDEPLGFHEEGSRRGIREVHNKLEKNRRAHLKECFELIQRQLPPGQDNRKSSHLSILHNAIKYIQVLRRKDREFEHEMEKLAREKIALQQRVGQLKRELSARWDHLDVNTLILEEPEVHEDDSPIKPSPSVKNIPAETPQLISFTSRLDSAAKPQRTSQLATALISPVQLVPSSSLRVVPRESSNAENGKRIVTISGNAFGTAKFKSGNQPITHVVTPLNTSHGTLITPVTVVSQGTQIAQIISAPSSKIVAPYGMKPFVSQYLVKHGSAVVVRNQTSTLTQTSSK